MKKPRAVDRPEPTDVLLHLASRYSVSPKHLGAPAPGRAELLRAAALALRAPDHEALRPYRFVHIDAHQRATLGELYARGCTSAAAATTPRCSGPVNAPTKALACWP